MRAAVFAQYNMIPQLIEFHSQCDIHIQNSGEVAHEVLALFAATILRVWRID